MEEPINTNKSLGFPRDSDTSKQGAFLLGKGVKKGKDKELKLGTNIAIRSCGLSHRKFYEDNEITRHQWYYWSWGLIDFPDWLKIKLCDKYKPFRDLFLSFSAEPKKEVGQGQDLVQPFHSKLERGENE